MRRVHSITSFTSLAGEWFTRVPPSNMPHGSDDPVPGKIRVPVSKRLLDITVALVGLVLLSPLFGVAAIAIKMSDKGPVFHRARRVGRGGKVFNLLKFRTMVVGADRLGPGITAKGDSRITPIGRYLRRTKLDELPQLINVLLGQMSLVGPRPEDPRYVALYTPEQRIVLRVRPGMTSMASIVYRHEESALSGPDWEEHYRNEIMPNKLKIELDSLANQGIWSDMKLILRTVAAIIK